MRVRGEQDDPAFVDPGQAAEGAADLCDALSIEGFYWDRGSFVFDDDRLACRAFGSVLQPCHTA